MGTATRGKWRGVSDAALGAIVSHPVRCRLLTIFADRVASPTEIAQELDVPVGDVSYHVRTLHEAGVIELVSERPVRGSTEHFYRASAKPYVGIEGYEAMSAEDRLNFGRTIFQVATADASVAFESGKFVERVDHHITRVPFAVDEAGWKQMAELFQSTLDRVFEIQAESEARLAEAGEKPVFGTAFQTLFETGNEAGRGSTADGSATANGSADA